jgi:hypothetical protein
MQVQKEVSGWILCSSQHLTGLYLACVWGNKDITLLHIYHPQTYRLLLLLGVTGFNWTVLIQVLIQLQSDSCWFKRHLRVSFYTYLWLKKKTRVGLASILVASPHVKMGTFAWFGRLKAIVSHGLRLLWTMCISSHLCVHCYYFGSLKYP